MIHRVGQKSKLLILSEYVNKTEKIGGMWTNKNSYRENEALSDIFMVSILCHSCFMFKSEHNGGDKQIIECSEIQTLARLSGGNRKPV